MREALIGDFSTQRMPFLEISQQAVVDDFLSVDVHKRRCTNATFREGIFNFWLSCLNMNGKLAKAADNRLQNLIAVEFPIYVAAIVFLVYSHIRRFHHSRPDTCNRVEAIFPINWVHIVGQARKSFKKTRGVNVHPVFMRFETEFLAVVIDVGGFKLLNEVPLIVNLLQNVSKSTIEYQLCFRVFLVRQGSVFVYLVENDKDRNNRCYSSRPATCCTNPGAIAKFRWFLRGAYRFDCASGIQSRYEKKQADRDECTEKYPVNWLHSIANSTDRLRTGVRR